MSVLIVTGLCYALLDAGADATIIEYLSQGSDHLASLHFPKCVYLKG
jgi:23S rRNA G2069 N7-methylase RlmK/C1962 C5-methylase RlmI